jgi:hypothetical protein
MAALLQGLCQPRRGRECARFQASSEVIAIRDGLDAACRIVTLRPSCAPQWHDDRLLQRRLSDRRLFGLRSISSASIFNALACGRASICSLVKQIADAWCVAMKYAPERAHQ